MSGIDLTREERSKVRRVGNVLTRCKGVGVFGSALLRREWVRGFGFGIGCSGVIQMTRDGCRQVGIGRIGVDMVTVVTGLCVSVVFLSCYRRIQTLYPTSAGRTVFVL